MDYMDITHLCIDKRSRRSHNRVATNAAHECEGLTVFFYCGSSQRPHGRSGRSRMFPVSRRPWIQTPAFLASQRRRTRLEMWTREFPESLWPRTLPSFFPAKPPAMSPREDSASLTMSCHVEQLTICQTQVACNNKCEGEKNILIRK